jgi:hypothetical protein
MKTAYELAMERLSKASPSARLNAEQKRQIAELDSLYASRIAGREISMKDEIARAIAAGELENADKLRRQLAGEKKSLQDELEDKKDKVRRDARK